MKIISNRIAAIVLILCFFLNSTTVFAAEFYHDSKTGVESVSAVEAEKERLKKKFAGMKDWIQDLQPYESFIAKNQTFFKFREELSKFFSKIRREFEEQWNKRYTTLL